MVYAHRFRATGISSAVLFCCSIAFAQDGSAPTAPPSGAQTPPPAPPPIDKNAPELVQHDEPAVFKSRVNLVLVPVVVRNKQGKATGDLRREDFQLYDKGKLQEISKFSVEVSAPKPGAAKPAGAGTNQDGTVPDVPERFVAYLFDDIHVSFEDLARSRDAADHNVALLQPTDRAAIYTTSGQGILEFTDDRQKLHEALFALRPRPIARAMMQECPDLSYYMADLIDKGSDPQALSAAISEAISCMGLDPTDPNSAKIALQTVQAAARRVDSAGQQESRVSLLTILAVVRRMSAMPGQRTVVLVSPGFIKPELQQEENDIVDRAIRSNVIISALDARGLYTDVALDASKRVFNVDLVNIKAQYDRSEASLQADVLAELASGTGGTFVQNSNDLEAGFKQTATAPEYIYVLGFSPQNLKLDGSFHNLKVAIKAKDLSATARKGYYAPRHLEDPAEMAKREMEEALFSREETHDLPVEMRTQFFKESDEAATITVVAHFDMKHVPLRKADGRNLNTLSILTGLFDRNGNFVAGMTKTAEMRLKDETLQKILGQGISIKTTLDVKPGTYAVRLVVRDAEGQLMTAENGVVEIP